MAQKQQLPQEMQVVLVQPEKKKIKIQFSKIITVFILLIITVTWAIGLYHYWNDINLYNYILDYVTNISLGVLPYFCLSAMDRVNYIMQAKYNQKNQE